MFIKLDILCRFWYILQKTFYGAIRLFVPFQISDLKVQNKNRNNF